ncbi:hypothetical protein KQX54_004670 [Cotesia glomerata]|uniref:Uncharacterized protein n=1 Tax=Cotesia glomerata TaxID=32391 RepID=A0AAV7IXF0_COTGL|nr:hypothetical protein KQX54_004670 [Cotesia glomerata]
MAGIGSLAVAVRLADEDGAVLEEGGTEVGLAERDEQTTVILSLPLGASSLNRLIHYPIDCSQDSFVSIFYPLSMTIVIHPLALPLPLLRHNFSSYIYVCLGPTSFVG